MLTWSLSCLYTVLKDYYMRGESASCELRGWRPEHLPQCTCGSLNLTTLRTFSKAQLRKGKSGDDVLDPNILASRADRMSEVEAIS
jgi:hypothetical protein